MNLARLDHVTIACSDLSRSVEFYTAVIGLVAGPRPDFDFPGAWLYLRERPVLHLIGGREIATSGTGVFDHFSLFCDDIDSARQRLSELDVAFDEMEVPGMPLRQFFIVGPDGVKVELTFEVQS